MPSSTVLGCGAESCRLAEVSLRALAIEEGRRGELCALSLPHRVQICVIRANCTNDAMSIKIIWVTLSDGKQQQSTH
jgi:hypothetical protein